MSLLVVGSVALDTIHTPLKRSKLVLGGSASYFSLGASFFAPVKMVAVVGDDFPERYIKLFGQKQIDLSGLSREKGETFRWEGEYGPDFSDPRTISTQLNVFSDFRPQIPKAYRLSRFVFLANIDPELQLYVLNRLGSRRLCACDTMDYWIKSKRKHLLQLLKRIDILMINESEIRQLTSETVIIKAAKKTLSLGPNLVVVKRGKNGIAMVSREGLFIAPAYPVLSVVDPTGAGDTFAGGFMGYLAAQKGRLNMRRAALYGIVSASYAVERFGPESLTRITRPSIDSRLAAYKKMTAV